MLKRRKWLVALPTLAVGLGVAWVVLKLPNFYESTTSLTLKPPTISEKVVQSLSEEDLSQRLHTINQEVLSRSSLEPMVAKYKLFENEKAAGMPMELIIDRMRKNIKVEPEKGDNEKVAGFRITYLDRSPEAARNVAAELAGKYVNAQVIASTENAEKTREFIEKQLAEAKSNLDAMEAQRMQIMAQNVDTLPDTAQGLIAQLQGLHQRADTTSKEKETLIVEKGRLNDSIRMMNNQINLTDTFGKKDVDDETRKASVVDTPAYASLVKERADLRAKLENYKKVYTDKMAEVVETRTKIEKIDDELKELEKNEQKKKADAASTGNSKVALQKKNIELEVARAQSQIQQIDMQIQVKDAAIQQNSMEIASMEAKINAVPGVAVQLEGIDNQYKTAKTNYDELMKKHNDAMAQVDRESNAQGETIRVVDSANLPSSPVNATKKPMFIGMGLAVGMAIGLLLASIFEVPRLLRIQNIEDAKHYTGLPVLASVPPLLTQQEIAWQSRSRWMMIMAGVVAAAGSIPLIIIGLQASRVFERMLQM